MLVGLAPFDCKVPSWQGHCDPAAGAAQARGSYRGSTGRRAACFGKACASLPGAQLDVRARDDLREGGIDPLRKHRMVLKQRADPAEIVTADVIDPKDDVGISHAQGGWGMQQGTAARPNFQLDGS